LILILDISVVICTKQNLNSLLRGSVILQVLLLL
jgi:hypothetical protein